MSVDRSDPKAVAVAMLNAMASGDVETMFALALIDPNTQAEMEAEA